MHNPNSQETEHMKNFLISYEKDYDFRDGAVTALSGSSDINPHPEGSPFYPWWQCGYYSGMLVKEYF